MLQVSRDVLELQHDSPSCSGHAANSNACDGHLRAPPHLGHSPVANRYVPRLKTRGTLMVSYRYPEWSHQMVSPRYEEGGITATKRDRRHDQPTPRPLSLQFRVLTAAVMLVSEPVAPACRFRARVMYDGSAFAGMQTQPHGNAVADVLEVALAKRFGGAMRVCAASRTDTGVHARGQAIHFDLQESSKAHPPPAVLQRSLNALLPPSVRLVDLEQAPERDALGRLWHARLWATGKLYSYRLFVGPVLDPLRRHERMHILCPFDLSAVRSTIPHLTGLVDCAALANRRSGEELPMHWDLWLTQRAVRAIELVDEGEGLLRIDFHVQSALYKMVRNIVGLLLHIGSGRCAPEDVPKLLASRDRSLLPPPAPAHGLTLESVYYGRGWGGVYNHPLHQDEASFSDTEGGAD